MPRLSQPASSSASARTASRSGSSSPAGSLRCLYAAKAILTTVGVRQAAGAGRGRNGVVPNTSRTTTQYRAASSRISPLDKVASNTASSTESQMGSSNNPAASQEAVAAMFGPSPPSAPLAASFAAVNSSADATPSANRSAPSTTFLLRSSTNSGQMLRQQATASSLGFRPEISPR
jgi:hypothetical protein